MALEQNSPFDEVFDNRRFGNVLDPSRRGFGELSTSFDDDLMGGDEFSPSSDMRIEEKPDQYEVLASIPGASGEGVNIEYDSDNHLLRVFGESQVEQSDEGSHQFSSSSFDRSISVPDEYSIDEEDIRAKFNNGLLQVILPKANSQNRRITIEEE
jgi:HSP20 family protein